MSIIVKDHVLNELRDAVSDNDVAILALVNNRLKLVTALWDYKRRIDIPLKDEDVESWRVRYLLRHNRGPLSPEGTIWLANQLMERTAIELRQTFGEK
jgi:chorismate mutase